MSLDKLEKLLLLDSDFGDKLSVFKEFSSFCISDCYSS